jgi:L-alanine-DL-glutamate epimerase-like enolase superfamily enzyme
MPAITDIKCHVLDLDVSARFGFKRGFEFQSVLVRIETDEGLEGYGQPTCIHGEAYSVAHAITGVIRPLLIGRDPRFVEGNWQHIRAHVMKGQVPRNSIGSVDIAMWDLAGKFAGQPVFRMLSPVRDKILAYASTVTLQEPEEYGPHCKELKETGFQAIKLHIKGEPDWDIAACRASREAVGDDFELMYDVDGAYGYDHHAAIYVGRAIQEMGFTWYETPLAQDDREGYAELRAKLDVPIAGPDMLFDLDDFPEWVSRRATEIVRPNAEFQFGLTGQRKVAALAERFHIRCEPHTFGTSISQAANLAGVCSINSTKFFEMPVPVGLLDAVTTTTIQIDSEGYVHAPTGPGLGVEIDFDDLDRRTKAVIS